MKQILRGLVLLLTTAVLAQQPGQPPPTAPPQGTPPTFPEGRAPRQQMPPDQEAPQGLSTSEVQQQIQRGFNLEPTLRNSNVGAHVDENSVILTGTVDSEQKHGLALRIAQSYAGDRKIVDKIKVTQQT
jgi:BON domain